MDLTHTAIVLTVLVLSYLPDGASYVIPLTDVSIDTCDWTLWDDTVAPKGVHNVFAKCTEGRIDWHHPFGAIRILLQLPSGVRSYPFFEACFRAKSHYTAAKISLETDGDEPVLSPIVILDEENPSMSKEICFTSTIQTPVVLFVEAEIDMQSSMSGKIEIDYDIQRLKSLPNGDFADSMEDCRPCTDAELLQAACSSDFVVQGSIDTVLHKQEFGESLVQLHVDRIQRQRHVVFSNSLSLTPGGEVVVPHKCGIQEGDGEFLFMGRVRLRRALLRCAPRLQEFQSLWSKAVEVGVNPCILE
ncbi:hypothetical protein CAPTEDRAFT_181784 [Capitella teleta]|uniref:Meteorin-like protein n=1 Tax=Capitella teleta TaxID=283909 RepID=R7T6Q6_CAPTE|nr:hypothetical protein CAPTEDRAFT_181784 [Capitella teleta]|eukprot:ELT89210.1 hypothetical protein CAPTEDRAFT_181784 [Capitella teleta]